MKVSLAFALLLATMAGAQTTQDRSDLIVLKFSCGKYEKGSGVIRSISDLDPPQNGPITINQTARNEPQEVQNRRDMQARREEMSAAEANARNSSQANAPIYFYRLQVKNASTKIVRGFFWEYQPEAEPDTTDRQFYCSIKTKPNEKTGIELLSPLAPTRLVDAANLGDKPEKNLSARIIINKIEYEDGSVWVRPGWNPQTFAPDAVQKVLKGKCIGL